MGAKSREKSEYMSALGQNEDMRAIKKRCQKLRRTHFDTTYVLVGLGAFGFGNGLPSVQPALRIPIRCRITWLDL